MVTVLILGKRGNEYIDTGGRLYDTIKQLIYDPKTKKAVLVDIPRDTVIFQKTKKQGNVPWKINRLGRFGKKGEYRGIGAMNKAVEYITGQDSVYYVNSDWERALNVGNKFFEIKGGSMEIDNPFYGWDNKRKPKKAAGFRVAHAYKAKEVVTVYFDRPKVTVSTSGQILALAAARKDLTYIDKNGKDLGSKYNGSSLERGERQTNLLFSLFKAFDISDIPSLFNLFREQLSDRSFVNLGKLDVGKFICIAGNIKSKKGGLAEISPSVSFAGANVTLDVNKLRGSILVAFGEKVPTKRIVSRKARRKERTAREMPSNLGKKKGYFKEEMSKESLTRGSLEKCLRDNAKDESDYSKLLAEAFKSETVRKAIRRSCGDIEWMKDRLERERKSGKLFIPENKPYAVFINSHPEKQYAVLFKFESGEFAPIMIDLVSTGSSDRWKKDYTTPERIYTIKMAEIARDKGLQFGSQQAKEEEHNYLVYRFVQYSESPPRILMHLTNEERKLGEPASHGCVRISRAFNKALETRYVAHNRKGTRVVVSQG